MSQHVQTQTALATCPGCGQGVRLEHDIPLGKQVTCPNCDRRLVVIETIPVKLDWVYEEWDIDEDDW